MVRVVAKRRVLVERETLRDDGRVARALRLDGRDALEPDVAVALPRDGRVVEDDEPPREYLLLKRPRPLVPRRLLQGGHVALHRDGHGSRPADVPRRVRHAAATADAVHRRRDVLDAEQAAVGAAAVGDDNGGVSVGVDAAHVGEVLLLVEVVVLHDAERVDPEVRLVEAVRKLYGVGDGAGHLVDACDARPRGRAGFLVTAGNLGEGRRDQGAVALQRRDVALERLEGGVRAPDVAQREVPLTRPRLDEAAPLDVDKPLGVVREDAPARLREVAVRAMLRVAVVEPLPDAAELDPRAQAALRHEPVAEVLELVRVENRRGLGVVDGPTFAGQDDRVSTEVHGGGRDGGFDGENSLVNIDSLGGNRVCLPRESREIFIVKRPLGDGPECAVGVRLGARPRLEPLADLVQPRPGQGEDARLLAGVDGGVDDPAGAMADARGILGEKLCVGALVGARCGNVLEQPGGVLGELPDRGLVVDGEVPVHGRWLRDHVV